MKRGFTLIEIIVVLAIIVSLVAFGIPGLMRTRITSNETVAQATLKTISTAIETYAAANGGTYPTEEAVLISIDPPYLNKSYCTHTESGYTYGCTINPADYTLTARPQSCVNTGTKSFTMTTGGVLLTDATCTEAGG